MAGNDFAAKNKPALVKLLKVLQEANDYWRANKEDVIKLTASYLRVSEDNIRANAENILYPSTEELVQASQDGTAEKWLSGLAEMFVTMGKLGQPGNTRDYFLKDLWVEAAGTRKV